MKIFNKKSDFATVPAIEKMMKKRFSRFSLDFYRNNDGSYTITTDRAEVATLSFRVYSRSFDLVATDIYDRVIEEPISYHGSNWKDFLSRHLDDLARLINRQKVRDGYIIRHDFNEMMRVLMVIDEINGAKTGDNRQMV